MSKLSLSLRSGSLRSGVAAAAIAFGFSTMANAQQRAPLVDPPEPASVAAHVARAKEIAGKDPILADMASNGYWCKSPANAAQYISVPTKSGVAPAQLFDNLYLFGTGFVGMYALKTSDGVIVWDTLDNEEEIRTIFEPGMKQFNLNPADIKYVILTHGHYDHFGGAKYLQDKYHVPVGLSAADWDLMAATPARAGGPQPPMRDKVLTDGQEIKVGDTTVRIVLTPGHSPATVSSIVSVKDGGATRVMAMWGGTAYPATSAAVKQMRDSTQKFKEAARTAGAVGILNTHAFFYDLVGRKAKQAEGAPNPLVIGPHVLARTMDIKAECADAQLAWYGAMGK